MDKYAVVEIDLELDPSQDTQGQAATGLRSYKMEIQADVPSEHYWRRDLRGTIQVQFDKLAVLDSDPSEYGKAFSELILNDAVRGYLEPIRKEIEDLDRQQNTTTPLRVILNLDESAPELHGLRWEALQDYRDQSWLVTKQDVLFSRCLIASTGKRPSLRVKSDLKAIIAVANPKDLADPDRYRSGIGPIPVEAEIRRAKKALEPVVDVNSKQLKVLARVEDNEPPVSLDRLAAALKEGADLFYLVCHGGLLGRGREAKAAILLENEQDATGDVVQAELLISHLKDITENKLPRLVVLASCESSGSGTITDASAVLQAVGPMLAALGIPAVIAMQGKISMETVETLIPAFFEALIQYEGQVDQALAAARSAVRDRPDAWMPVLYLGLKEGRLWTEMAPSSDPLKIYLDKAGEEPVYPFRDKSMETMWREVPFRVRAARSANEDGEDLYQLIRTRWLEEAGNRFQRMVLLGSAGQGKSTALKWMLTKFAQEASQYLSKRASARPKEIIIPINFSLSKLRPPGGIAQLALESINDLLTGFGSSPIQMDQLYQWGNEHRLLFLIDDLEELITRRHDIGVETLTQFMNEQPFINESFLVACRSSSYQNQLGIVDIIELLDLKKADVDKVLGKKQLSQFSPQIEKLAKNRSMLRLILEVEDKNFKTQGQLTKKWVEEQLDLNDEHGEGIEDFLMKKVLEKLAFEMRRTHSLAYAESEVIDIVNSCLGTEHESYYWRDFLKTLTQKALLLNPVKRTYSFTERIYGDYFAAEAAIKDKQCQRYMLGEISDYWWRDMLEILVGLDEDPADLFYEMIDRDALVAALCVQSAPFKPDSQVYSALIDGLAEQMENKSTTRRKEIVDRIVQSGHPRVPEVLLRRLHREWASLVLLAIARGLEQWKQTPGQIQELVKKEAAVLEGLPLETEPLRDWLQIKTPICPKPDECQDDGAFPEELEQMKNILDDVNRPEKMRGLAAISLGLSGYKRAGDKLLEIIQKPDMNDLVAWCAVEALAEFPRPDVRGCVYDLLMEYRSVDFKNQPSRYRARLIYLLGFLSAEVSAKETGSTPTSQEVLRQALVDDEPAVRGFAINAWVRLNYKDAQMEVENIIKKNDEKPLVLRKAAEAIGLIGTRDSIRLLESRLALPVVKENQSVRSAYRKAIKEIQERLGI